MFSNVCVLDKVLLVSFYPILTLFFTCFTAAPLFSHFTEFFWASGVDSSLCGVGSIPMPVSWGVSEICSFFRGTTALVSCVINCTRWWSTGPVHIWQPGKPAVSGAWLFFWRPTLFFSGVAGHPVVMVLFF